MKTYAIGDIHGCSKALEKLFETVPLEKGDRIVTLGDYIDRGPDSRGVIDILIEASKRFDLVPLRGNHEALVFKAEKDRRRVRAWLINGGEATLDSYNAKNFSHFPRLHWEFLKETRKYYETEDTIFVHANLDPLKPLDSQDDNDLLWRFFDSPVAHVSGKRMICGHTPQVSGKPLHVGHATCIDTDVLGERGWLTCLDVTANEYWQTNQHGDTNQGTLEHGNSDL